MKLNGVGHHTHLYVLNTNKRCHKNQIQDILQILKITEFDIIIDSEFNIIKSTFEIFLRCFVSVIELVAQKKDIHVNLFVLSNQSHPVKREIETSYHGKSKKYSTKAGVPSNLTSQFDFHLKLNCTETVLSEHDIRGIFFKTVNMYLRTFKKLI